MFTQTPELDLVLRATILGPIALLWIVTVVRIIGLRTFSKMPAFDSICTVATGLLLAEAATASTWSAFLLANIGLFSILGVQAVLAWLRRRNDRFSYIVENEPVILFMNGNWVEPALDKTRVTKNDIWAKLREANVLKLKNVWAVVLETTGDVSVLHDENLDQTVLNGVQSKGQFA